MSAPRGGFAPRIELAFGDSASLRRIRGKAGASEMRPYQCGAYPPAEGSPKGRLRGVLICRAGAEGVFRRNAISRESPVHQRQVGGLEPTVAREHVCGPDVISTATVKGAREISAGRSPLAKQVARAVRARRNHVGGVPANCGSVSPERSEPRSGRYAGCEQVGPSPRLPKPKLAPPRPR